MPFPSFPAPLALPGALSLRGRSRSPSPARPPSPPPASRPTAFAVPAALRFASPFAPPALASAVRTPLRPARPGAAPPAPSASPSRAPCAVLGLPCAHSFATDNPPPAIPSREPPRGSGAQAGVRGRAAVSGTSARRSPAHPPGAGPGRPAGRRQVSGPCRGRPGRLRPAGWRTGGGEAGSGPRGGATVPRCGWRPSLNCSTGRVVIGAAAMTQGTGRKSRKRLIDAIAAAAAGKLAITAGTFALTAWMELAHG